MPAPGTGGPLGRARAVANRAFAETIGWTPTGTATAMGTGTATGTWPAGEEHATVGGAHSELPSGDGGDGPEQEPGDS